MVGRRRRAPVGKIRNFLIYRASARGEGREGWRQKQLQKSDVFRSVREEKYRSKTTSRGHDRATMTPVSRTVHSRADDYDGSTAVIKR